MNTKRTLLVLFVAVAACNRGIDQKKFEGIYRSGQAIKSATDVGVSPVRYRELLQNFASEVAIATDSAKSDREREMVGDYATALEAYRDAGRMLTLKIERDGGTFLTTSVPDVVPLITKYGLTTDLVDPDAPSVRRFSPDTAMQEIWVFANRSLATANARYTGKPQS